MAVTMVKAFARIHPDELERHVGNTQVTMEVLDEDQDNKTHSLGDEEDHTLSAHTTGLESDTGCWAAPGQPVSDTRFSTKPGSDLALLILADSDTRLTVPTENWDLGQMIVQAGLSWHKHRTTCTAYCFKCS